MTSEETGRIPGGRHPGRQRDEMLHPGPSSQPGGLRGGRPLPAKWVLSTFVIPAGSLLAVWLDRRTPYEDFVEALARSWEAVTLSFAIPILVATVVAFGKNRRVAGTFGVLALGIPLIEWMILLIRFREPCPPLDEWCGFGRGYGTLAVIVCTAPVVLLFALAALTGACRRQRHS